MLVSQFFSKKLATRLNAGYFYSMLKKFDKADKYFEMALKINCDDTVACVNKARNYLKNNEIMATHPLIRRLKEVRF